MAKQHSAMFGPITGLGETKAKAKASAMELAEKTLRVLDHAQPWLAVCSGWVCVVFPTIMPDGAVLWAYTNPRELSDLAPCSPDALRRVGSGGYWADASRAASKAIAHILQIRPDGIPADLPESLHPDDAAMLRGLRSNAALVA